MTDDEFLEKVKNYLADHRSFTPEEQSRLVALARIGARVQPRPISEVGEIKERLIQFGPLDAEISGRIFHWTTHFTPLSALSVKPSSTLGNL